MVGAVTRVLFVCVILAAAVPITYLGLDVVQRWGQTRPVNNPTDAPLPNAEHGIAASLGKAVSGELVHARAAGASPGEHVWFLFGTEPGMDACTGNFGARCEAIADFQIADRVPASDQGLAETHWRVPAGHIGPVYVQVGVVRGHRGDESLLSEAISTNAVRP